LLYAAVGLLKSPKERQRSLSLKEERTQFSTDLNSTDILNNIGQHLGFADRNSMSSAESDQMSNFPKPLGG
jgi:hypothetical protein